MKRIAALAVLVVLSGHTKPPPPTTGGTVAYEVLQASPSVFDDVLGFRDLYQSGMIVRTQGGLPPPNVVSLSTRYGMSVALPVTNCIPLAGGSTWWISTAHVVVSEPDGYARLVAKRGAATYRGALVTFQ